VRVIWLASIVVDTSAPPNGVNLDELLRPSGTSMNRNYENTKVGNWFLADDLAKQAGAGDDGILSVVVNPGNLKTNLTRHLPSWVPFLVAPLLYPPVMGAYSELWAGFSPELTLKDGGKYVLPWGRVHPRPRGDLVRAMRGREEGGTGDAGVFLRYCYDQIEEFM
jgi:NAD(P)-dependent dehydrogenase (short-subunit alcohol dehydrogenase family)